MAAHTCGKARYRSSHQADQAMQSIRKFGSKVSGHKPSRMYLCPSCRGWHLTSY